MKPMMFSEYKMAEFQRFVNTDVANGGRSHQRVGQHLMNCMAQYDEALYRAASSDLCDPFYNDDLIGDFITFCMEYWAKHSPEVPQQQML